MRRRDGYAALKTELEYPLTTVPEPGTAIPLAPRMLWVRLPVPGALRHINVWLLDDGESWTLVDTGMNTAESRAAWIGALEAELGGRPIRRILCTHHHPDHAGLVQFLAERHGADIWMSAGEVAVFARIRACIEDAAVADERVAALEAEGLAVGDEMRALVRFEQYRSRTSGFPTKVEPVADGDTFVAGGRDWRVFILAGHTDAQAVLWCERDGLLISGDQVLPRISSNVGIYPERADRDPVRSYLESFDVLEELPRDTLVLPAHGNPFVGLHARIASLRAHHAATLEQVASLLAEPRTAAEVATQIFVRKLDTLNTYLALGETLAHVRCLVNAGAVTQLDGAPNRYVAVS
jgi:glyoxylase-like metal-dependent hydrolase (beta-lactamase superfamily II)